MTQLISNTTKLLVSYHCHLSDTTIDIIFTKIHDEFIARVLLANVSLSLVFNSNAKGKGFQNYVYNHCVNKIRRWQAWRYYEKRNIF